MEKIIVTGLGAVSTAGHTLTKIWDELYSGNITYSPMNELLDRTDFRIKIGAKIKNEDWAENVPEFIMKKYGKAACYSVSAVLRALNDSGIDLTKVDKKRISLVIGTTMGEIEVEETITELLVKEKKAVQDGLYEQMSSDNILKAIAQATGIEGHMYMVPAACAAGNYALSIGKQLIKWGYADVVIAGGVDVFSKVSFAGFQRLLSLAPDYCRPFDKDRKGLVVGEGAGIVIMENSKNAIRRKGYGTVMGVGLASNAYHMTAPHKEGQGEHEAMKKAIEDAGISSRDIHYICAHGTGTKANDKLEVHAIKRLYQQFDIPPVSSVKSMMGHSMGAASALELILSFLMLKHQIVLPTMNCRTRDKDCDIDIVDGASRSCSITNIMSNAFAFGGQTSSVVIGKN